VGARAAPALSCRSKAPRIGRFAACEHLFVSLSALPHAIRAKEADRASEVAGAMKRVPLRYAARLTVLLADMEHPRYEAAARRFIVAFTEELEPKTMQVKKLADALAHVHHYYYAHFAREALQNLIGQLHEQGRSVEVDFDSEPDNPRRKSRP
jgi:LmbE family N-acetylglucosaminyl deacetylase